MDKHGYEYKIVYEKLREKLIQNETRDDSYASRFSSIDSQISDARHNIGFNLYTPIETHRKITGKAIVNWKRFVRRSIAWLIGPLFYEQSVKNSRFTQIFFEMSDALKEMSMLNNNAERHLYDRFNYIQSGLQSTVSNANNDIDQINENLNRVWMAIDGMRSSQIRTVSDASDLLTDCKRSYSQSGEDLIVFFVFSVLKIDITKLTYIDIGANHAIADNNTYLFYEYGSKGVLVEANPKIIPELACTRPMDVVINNAISDQGGIDLQFYVMNYDGLSSLNPDFAERAMKENPNVKIESTIDVKTITVNDIIKKYLNDKTPDFISLDVESMELTVLESIDFTKYRPKIFIVETIDYKNSLPYDTKDQKISEFMKSKEYDEYCFTGINTIFIDTKVN